MFLSRNHTVQVFIMVFMYYDWEKFEDLLKHHEDLLQTRVMFLKVHPFPASPPKPKIEAKNMCLEYIQDVTAVDSPSQKFTASGFFPAWIRKTPINLIEAIGSVLYCRIPR